MLNLEALLGCVTEFDALCKTVKEENVRLTEKKAESREKKLETLIDFLKPYSDIARKVSVQVYVEPFIKVGTWLYGIRLDSYDGEYSYGIYHGLGNRDRYWCGYIDKNNDNFSFVHIAYRIFRSYSSEDAKNAFEEYIDGILLHKDLFEEKFEEAIHRSMEDISKRLLAERTKLEA